LPSLQVSKFNTLYFLLQDDTIYTPISYLLPR
jgi:hypothetical protein